MDEELDAMPVDALMEHWRNVDLRLRDYALGYSDHVWCSPTS